MLGCRVVFWVCEKCQEGEGEVENWRFNWVDWR